MRMGDSRRSSLGPSSQTEEDHVEIKDSVVKPDYKVATVQELQIMMTYPQDYFAMIIFDVRPKSEFLKGHIDYPTCICLPPEIIKNESTIACIRASLIRLRDAKAYRIYKKRLRAEKIVVYDDNSSYKSPKEKLKLLCYLFRECGLQILAILEGGYEKFSSQYPDLISTVYNDGAFRPGEIITRTPYKRPDPATRDTGPGLIRMYFPGEEGTARVSSRPLVPLPLYLLPCLMARIRNRGPPPKKIVRLERNNSAPPPPTSRDSPEKSDGQDSNSSKPESQISIETIPLQVTPPPKAAGLPRGIKNLGSSCFMSVIFQCLNLTQGFLPALVKDLNSGGPGHAAARWSKLIRLVCEKLREKRTVPVGIGSLQKLALASTSTQPENFGDGLQHDVYDFFQWLLMTMDEEFAQSSSIISVFQTVHTTMKTCLRCEVVEEGSPNSEIVTSLPVPDHETTTLEDCLAGFIQPQKLEDRACSSCRARDTEQVMEFSLLPPVLVFHLHRYRAVRDALGRISFLKLKCSVTIPESETLDMSPYLASGCEPSKGVCRYELYAIVNHEGDTTTSGHYTAYGKDHQGTWFHFNDSIVEKIDPSSINTAESYLYFFRQQLDTSREETQDQDLSS